MELAPEGSSAQAALGDHLLEDIFVRIGDPADLTRASAACKAFRRLVTDPIFLRRYRSIHPPLLLGRIQDNLPYNSRFVPADAPHPNAPAARALAGAADFSFDQVPGRHRWRICDASGGRVLLLCLDPFDRNRESPKLAVCDPLTRGYTLLPPIPDDLLSPVRDLGLYSSTQSAFFDPSGGNDEAQFRVMCWAYSPWIAVKFVYSSLSGSWTHGTSILPLQVERNPITGPHRISVYGCLYWDVGISNKMVKLDIKSMQSTTVNLQTM